MSTETACKSKPEEQKDTIRWLLNFLKYYERKYKVPEEKSLLKKLLDNA